MELLHIFTYAIVFISMNCQNEYFNTCSNFTYCESNECLQHNESMQNTIDHSETLVKLCLQSLQKDEEVRFLSC